METAKELLDSLRLSLTDRLNNPIIGAFALAWLAWNFRLPFILVSDGEWKAKIDFIDKVLMPNWSDWLIHGYLIPLGFAICWVFVLPQIFRRVLVFHKSQAATTAKAVMVAEGKAPISSEEATKIRLKLRESSLQWEEERAAYLRQNEELSERISTLQKATSPESPTTQVEEATSLGDEIIGGNDDPLVDFAGKMLLDKNGKPIWPMRLTERDLEQLPSSVATKVAKHKFESSDIQALLAMRNWPTVTALKLGRTLGIENFDAQVIIDRLRDIELLQKGSEGLFLNADGRMLTAYFKRALSEPAKAHISADRATNADVDKSRST